MERQRNQVGAHVIFVDSRGLEHNALVTEWHGTSSELNEPAINLVFVSGDVRRVDTYGRQIERDPTSVVHKSHQSAPGNFWRWPDE